MRNLTSSGLAFISKEVMMTFIPTDFPEPVAPAISKWGILLKSAKQTTPEMSRPSGTSKMCLLSRAASMISQKETGLTWVLGTSIPIKDLPGIGASIRTSRAASAKAISSDKETILLTLTPMAGWISYLVTDGPKLALTTLAWTPKLSKVRSNLAMFSLIRAYSSDWSTGGIFLSKFLPGNW